MVAVTGFTLPAVQVVYHLLALSNVTNSVPAVTQSSPHHRTKTLPDGYVAYPDIGLAYKYHRTHVSWIEANNLCIQEGAQLAVIDTLEKIQSIGPKAFDGYIHAGIVRLGKGEPWVNVHTGLQVSSVVWGSEGPFPENGDCAQFYLSEMWNYTCDDFVPYVCEIPIPPVFVDSTRTSN